MRLRDFLIESGFHVTILDYSRRVSLIKILATQWLASTADAAKGRKTSVVHIHVSAAEQYLYIGYILLLLSMYHPTVLTIHSGRLIDVVGRMSSVSRILLGWLFRHHNAVITVNHEQKRLLQTKFKVPEKRINVIPAFLPPTDVEQMAPIPDHRLPIVLAAGFAIPIYGYEILLNALESLKNRGQLFKAYLVFYTETDPSYEAKIRRQAEQLRVEILGSMTPGEFASLLMRTHVFVRPTFTDGDSSAIREAHWAGAHVLASDCVKRPKWSHCFPTGNSHSLALKLDQLLKARRPGIPESSLAHNGEAILRLYNSLL
jgi:glycosyltransferase involved in cell wall biosynthesis